VSGVCCRCLQKSASVVERHSLDIKRAQNGLLVDEVRVVSAGVTRRQDDAHVTEVDVDRSQVGSV